MTLNQKYLLILLLTPLAVYAHTLFFDYTYLDDNVLLKQNYYFNSDWHNITEAFKTGVFVNNEDMYYRPMLTLTFIADALVYGKSLWGYHITNILLHLINIYLLFTILKRKTENLDLSFYVVLFFAIHPVLVMAIGWIPGRNDTLLMMFILSGYYSFDKYIEAKAIKYLVLHLLSVAAAMYTKESGIGLILFILLLVFVFEKKGKESYVIYGVWAVILGIWYAVRKDVLKDLTPVYYSETTLSDIIITALQESPSILMYAGKVLFPYNLTVFPTITDSAWLPGFIALLLLSYIIFKLKVYQDKQFLPALLWIMLFLLPPLLNPGIKYSNFHLEHRLYVPMLGICWILILILKRVTVKPMYVVGVIAIFGVVNVVYARNFKDRTSFWEKAMKDTPHSAEPYSALGSKYFKEENYEKAFQMYNKALTVAYNINNCNYSLAQVYEKMNDFKNAEASYRKEIYLYPRNARAINNLANLLFKSGREDSVLYMLHQAKTLNPRVTEIYVNLGHYYYNKVQHDSAQVYFETALKQNPEMPEALNNLGMIHYYKGNNVKALQMIQEAIKLNDKFLEAYSNIATVYRASGDYANSLANYDMAISINPSFAVGYYNRAELKNAAGKLQEAYTDYKAAYRLMPQLPEVNNALGQYYFATGKRDTSEYYLRKAISLRKTFHQPYINLSRIYIQDKKWKRALELVDSALIFKNNSYEALSNKGTIYFNTNHLDSAKFYFDKSLAVNPSQAETLNNLGSIELNRKNYRQAIPYFKKALQVNPALRIINKNIALSYTQLGIPDSADYYKKLAN